MSNLRAETVSIAQAAGATIMGFYQDRSSFTVQDKTPDNPVTEADLAADRLLKERLLALVPAAGWLSEETVDSPERLARQQVWVVDPLDGTKEFVLGVPEFSVSVALVDQGRPILAVVHNPATNETYVAEAGRGTTLNDRPVTVTGREVLPGAQIDASRSERKRGEFAPFEASLEIRTMGSIAYKLARVAAGQCDATWSRGPKNEWDVCAGVLLVQEAGGCCVDLDDQSFKFNQSWPKVKSIIADNGHLHKPIIALLEEHGAARVD